MKRNEQTDNNDFRTSQKLFLQKGLYYIKNIKYSWNKIRRVIPPQCLVQEKSYFISTSTATLPVDTKCPNVDIQARVRVLHIHQTYFSDPPDVVTESPRVHARVGWSVKMSCRVWADPPALTTWHRGLRASDMVTGHTQAEAEVSQMVRTDDSFISTSHTGLAPFLKEYNTNKIKMINRCDLMLQDLKHFKTVIMSSSFKSVLSVQGKG